IPIYASGDGAAAVLSGNPRLAADLLAGHRGWGLAALAALAATGIVAAAALWSGRRKGFSGAEPGLVLGLALLTPVLTIIVAIDSWQINHPELGAVATGKTPQIWSHAHIILNHFPTIGFVFAFGFFVIALLTDNNGMKRASLVAFVLCAVLGVP